MKISLKIHTISLIDKIVLNSTIYTMLKIDWFEQIFENWKSINLNLSKYSMEMSTQKNQPITRILRK